MGIFFKSTLHSDSHPDQKVEIIITTVEGKQVIKHSYLEKTNKKFRKEIDMNQLPDQLYTVELRVSGEIMENREKIKRRGGMVGKLNANL